MKQHGIICLDWLSSLIHSNLLGLQQKPAAGFCISFKAKGGINCPLPHCPPHEDTQKRWGTVRRTKVTARLEFKYDKLPWWRLIDTMLVILLLLSLLANTLCTPELGWLKEREHGCVHMQCISRNCSQLILTTCWWSNYEDVALLLEIKINGYL